LPQYKRGVKGGGKEKAKNIADRGRVPKKRISRCISKIGKPNYANPLLVNRETDGKQENPKKKKPGSRKHDHSTGY